MSFNDGRYVGHAAVIDLHVVSVASWAKFVSRWKFFSISLRMIFPILVVTLQLNGGVEPGDVPFSLPLSAVFFRWLVL